MYKNRFIVYQITFGQRPAIQGVINEFDSLSKAKEYIKNSKNSVDDKLKVIVIGDAWIIQEKFNENSYKFHECIRIEK